MRFVHALMQRRPQPNTLSSLLHPPHRALQAPTLQLSAAATTLQAKGCEMPQGNWTNVMVSFLCLRCTGARTGSCNCSYSS